MNNDKHHNIDIRDDLDWDIQPERDLWPDISSNIRFAGKPKREKFNWVPVSVAACMMLAVSAVVLSFMSYQRSQQTYELQASFIEYQKAQISLIEQNHQNVRAQFVALIERQSDNLDPAFIAEVQAVMLTVDQASLELKEAILAQPTNPKYAAMLANTYQQELKLLNEFKSENGLSI